MAASRRTTLLRSAAVILGAALVLNVAFYFLADRYFRDVAEPVDVGHVKLVFALMTAIVALAACVAPIAPRLFGHGLAVALGLVSIGAGIAAFWTHRTAVMGTTLIV